MTKEIRVGLFKRNNDSYYLQNDWDCAKCLFTYLQILFCKNFVQKLLHNNRDFCLCCLFVTIKIHVELWKKLIKTIVYKTMD